MLIIVIVHVLEFVHFYFKKGVFKENLTDAHGHLLAAEKQFFTPAVKLKAHIGTKSGFVS